MSFSQLIQYESECNVMALVSSIKDIRSNSNNTCYATNIGEYDIQYVDAIMDFGINIIIDWTTCNEDFISYIIQQYNPHRYVLPNVKSDSKLLGVLCKTEPDRSNFLIQYATTDDVYSLIKDMNIPRYPFLYMNDMQMKYLDLYTDSSIIASLKDYIALREPIPDQIINYIKNNEIEFIVYGKDANLCTYSTLSIFGKLVTIINPLKDLGSDFNTITNSDYDDKYKSFTLKKYFRVIRDRSDLRYQYII